MLKKNKLKGSTVINIGDLWIPFFIVKVKIPKFGIYIGCEGSAFMRNDFILL